MAAAEAHHHQHPSTPPSMGVGIMGAHPGPSGSLDPLSTHEHAHLQGTGAGQAAGLAPKRRPLATLSALRRPPIDPIVLAASLTTGPHVTRHHFHHSAYGSKGGVASEESASSSAGGAGAGAGAGLGGGRDAHGSRAWDAHVPGGQMARSERLRLLALQRERLAQAQAQAQGASQPASNAAPSDSTASITAAAAIATSTTTPATTAAPRRRTRGASASSAASSVLRGAPPAVGPGSYANCDIDDVEDVAVAEEEEGEGKEDGLPAAHAPPRPARKDPAELEDILAAVMGGAVAGGAGRSGAPAPHALQEAHEDDLLPAAAYSSRQMPRSERLALEARVRAEREAALARQKEQQEREERERREKEERERREQAAEAERQASLAAAPRPAATPLPGDALSASLSSLQLSSAAGLAPASVRARAPLSVRCYARTRVPTPHGEVFCHLYRNNHDAKEHLALVVDWEQNDEDAMRVQAQAQGSASAPAAGAHAHGQAQIPLGKLRSRTLEEKWSPDETEIERIVRGAYVGRLGPTFQRASEARPRHAARGRAGTVAASDFAAVGGEDDDDDAAPLVRIHSECYTGETIGSQRCDCGEQLDEAIRLICASGPSYASGKPRGVIVYLRQEGRGIGLLDKLMAYNLQDMGHDTVSANVLLGHLPDARKYDIASAILRDLGVEQCRLLTNNPEKMEALEAEGVRVTQRVPMVPRMWRRSARKAHRRIKAKDASAAKRAAKARAAPASPKDKRVARTRESSHLHHSIISQFSAGAHDDHSHSHSEDDGAHEHGHAHSGGEMDGDAAFDDEDDDSESDASSVDSYVEHALRRSGATMLGGSATRGPELEKYLRTKVERMGHMLDLPPEEAAAMQRRTDPGPLPSRDAQRTAGAAAQQQHHGKQQHARKPPPHLRSDSDFASTPASASVPASAAVSVPSSSLPSSSREGSAGAPALTRTASVVSNLSASAGSSQPESVLGESELKEMLAGGSAPPSASAARGEAGATELAAALDRLHAEAHKLLAPGGAGGAALGSGEAARFAQSVSALPSSVEVATGASASASMGAAPAAAAEEVLDLASSALASDRAAELPHAAVAQLSQVVLLASRALRLARAAPAHA